jgi:hypothetical protein
LNDTTGTTPLATRLGGELPAFGDRIGAAQAWQPHWLPFSHGRAAFAWLLQQRKVGGAVYCAYVCATVEDFFRAVTVPTRAFDIGASAAEIAALARTLPAPRLVLVPALFGAPFWLDLAALQAALDPDDIIVIDAAQTAFGHIDFAPPKGGAVLSCPRKTTALGDGAVLAVDRAFESNDIARLPTADAPTALKLAARALWATDDPELERQAVAFNNRSEESWPDRPCRMSDLSRAVLERLDPALHDATRRRNRDHLAAQLKGSIPIWSVAAGTPFSLPIFVADRKAFLAKLHAARIFASPLWPDAPCQADRHPAATWFAAHLVSLPCDQRHTEADMDRIAAAVLPAAKAPETPVPAAVARFLSVR